MMFSALLSWLVLSQGQTPSQEAALSPSVRLDNQSSEKVRSRIDMFFAQLFGGQLSRARVELSVMRVWPMHDATIYSEDIRVSLELESSDRVRGVVDLWPGQKDNRTVQFGVGGISGALEWIDDSLRNQLEGYSVLLDICLNRGDHFEYWFELSDGTLSRDTLELIGLDRPLVSTLVTYRGVCSRVLFDLQGRPVLEIRIDNGSRRKNVAEWRRIVFERFDLDFLPIQSQVGEEAGVEQARDQKNRSMSASHRSILREAIILLVAVLILDCAH